MDPLLLAVGVGTAAAGLGTGLRLRQRLRRAEATTAELRQELAAEHHAANHDPLTGLPNRRAFYRLGHRLVADPVAPAVACVVVDLNSFKWINDTLGHAAGDEVLVVVARRLARFGGGGAGGNLIARLGGDEFAGLFTHPAADWALLDPATDRLAGELAAPMPVAGRQLRVTAAIGAAPVTRNGGLALALRQADSAMYRAKATGERAACYHPALDDEPARPSGRTLPADTAPPVVEHADRPHRTPRPAGARLRA